jgi:hypothetical protein
MTGTAPEIFVGIPSFSGKFGRELRDSLRGAFDELARRGISFHWADMGSSNLAQVRNRLVDKALKSGAKYLMFIDDDMVFEPNSIHRLWKHQLAIVGGLYVKRQFPYTVMAGLYDETTGKRDKPPKIGEGLTEVDAVATGFMLIATRVFDKVEQPYFAFPPRDGGGVEGEDYYFCGKAKEAGFKVWLDCGVRCGHRGRYVYTYDDRRIVEELQKGESEAGGVIQASG